jgi:hypothetical protein
LANQGWKRIERRIRGLRLWDKIGIICRGIDAQAVEDVNETESLGGKFLWDISRSGSAIPCKVL